MILNDLKPLISSFFPERLYLNIFNLKPRYPKSNIISICRPQVKESKAMDRIIMTSVKIKCPQSQLGCDWQGEISSFEVSLAILLMNFFIYNLLKFSCVPVFVYKSQKQYRILYRRKVTKYVVVVVCLFHNLQRNFKDEKYF